jgi:hypothetical protein
MAGEIGHVVYAARLLTYLRDQVEDPEYWVGTLFPNIRHLNVPSRHMTHPHHVGLSSLAGNTDFATGLRVHSWVDATRSHYFAQEHMKELLPWHPLVPYAFDLLEDELLYSHFDDWNLIHRLLNTVHKAELLYTAASSDILQWHSTLQHYVKKSPTDRSRYDFSRAVGLSDATANEVNDIVDVLRDNPSAERLLKKFWQHLEHLLR